MFSTMLTAMNSGGAGPSLFFFFVQDLGLLLVSKTYPHRPQALKNVKNGGNSDTEA